MKETVLLYNFDSVRLPLAKRALLPLKISVKAVDKQDYSQQIGYVAGLKGFEKTEDSHAGTFHDEMLVMCGFSGQKINALINALNKGGIGRVPLKAMLTPSNVSWNSVQLYEAVKADHEEMNGKNK